MSTSWSVCRRSGSWPDHSQWFLPESTDTPGPRNPSLLYILKLGTLHVYPVAGGVAVDQPSRMVRISPSHRVVSALRLDHERVRELRQAQQSLSPSVKLPAFSSKRAVQGLSRRLLRPLIAACRPDRRLAASRALVPLTSSVLPIAVCLSRPAAGGGTSRDVRLRRVAAYILDRYT